MAEAPPRAAASADAAIRQSITTPIGTPIIEARHLVKRYGNFTAVNGIDLAVQPQEIFGILGPNGAGKTTTLEMIEGLRQPDEGTIRVAGLDAVKQSDEVRRVIGVQLQTTALFDYLSATELIALFGGLYGTPPSAARIDELLGLVDLREKRNAKANELSGGQQQRLSIALALVNNPRIVFLDEPTTGLDPQARRNLWETVREIRAAGTTVVLTTHYMEEAEYLCDRVAVMDHGQIIACDTPEHLIRSLNMAATVQADVSGGELAASQLASLPGVTSSDNLASDGSLRLQTSDVQATLVGLLSLAEKQGVRLSNLRSTQASLEDVFLSLTGRSYEPGDEPSATNEPTGNGKKRGWRRGRS